MRRIGRFLPWLLTAIAVIAIAVWPWYVRSGTNAAHAASLPTPAPFDADYLLRDRQIAFWEGALLQHERGDMLSPAQVSALYLQRYRERGDVGDVLRAVHTARLSLRAQPYGNLAAEVDLASALLTLHRFVDALTVTYHAERYDPGDPAMLVREASLDLELGRYELAHRLIARVQRVHPTDADAIAADTLTARFDELTGHLARARARFARTTAEDNAIYGESAQGRAWFYFRSGELAFEAGDNDAALTDEHQALAVFPNYSEANRLLARFSCALHRWQECLTAAQASAQVVPFPEVLGYEVDAQRALGESAQAEQTDDLIRTIERIGNAQHIADRLFAVYYDDHDENLADAYRIAHRELAVRDDIFTEDTLAWAAAKDGRWDEARARIAAALRYSTENSLLRYHAGVIALHFGDRTQARLQFQSALALNPWFHPFYADDARRQLAGLRDS